MTHNGFIPPDACFDDRDKRDYHYTEVFWVATAPTKIEHKRTKVQNQWAINTPNTAYACTCYSAVHCVNEANAIEAENFKAILKEVDAVKIWSQGLQRGAILDKGWSLQGATKLMMDLGCITGYTLCRSVWEVKQALARGQLIQTGSNSIDWKKTIENDFIVVRGSSYGHAFMVEGYDDDTELLIMRNSYGNTVMSHGRFFVRYSDFDILYSCYAYADAESKEIRNEQQKRRLELVVNAGIFNGKDLDKELIRQDAVLMVAKTCKYDEPSDLWNKKNGLMPVIQRDLKSMFKKAWKTVTWIIDEEKTITRGQAWEWCARFL